LQNFPTRGNTQIKLEKQTFTFKLTTQYAKSTCNTELPSLAEASFNSLSFNDSYIRQDIFRSGKSRKKFHFHKI